MRAFLLSLAVLAGLSAVSGCTMQGDNARAIEAMNNPPNACGPGGTRDINACSSRR